MKAYLSNLSILYETEGQVPLGKNSSSGFCYTLDVYVGIEGERGEELFTIDVCNPWYLFEQIKALGIINGHGFLIVNKFNLKDIERFLESYICNLETKNWDDLIEKMKNISIYEV